jgi:kynurenine formamidase
MNGLPTGRIIDLSLKLEDNMTAHKLFQSPIIITHKKHSETESYNLGVPDDPMTFQMYFLSTLDHVGTHVDAFIHINPKGDPVDEMPLDLLMGKAVCLDLRHIPDLGDVDVADLEEARRRQG